MNSYIFIKKLNNRYIVGIKFDDHLLDLCYVFDSYNDAKNLFSITPNYEKSFVRMKIYYSENFVSWEINCREYLREYYNKVKFFK